MTSSKGLPTAEIKDEDPTACLLTKLPEEIKDEILKSIFSNMTVNYLGPWREYTEKEKQHLMEYEVNRLAGYILPNLFLISKTVLNKSEMVNGILRFARIKLESSTRIEYFARQLDESQKKFLKRVCITESDLVVPCLKEKIGRHLIHLTASDSSRFHEPLAASLCVPSNLLMVKEWEIENPRSHHPFSTVEPFRYLELDDGAKLDRISSSETQVIMFDCFSSIYEAFWFGGSNTLKTGLHPLSQLGRIVRAAYKQGTEVRINMPLVLKSDHRSRFLNNSDYNAVFSTKDWMLHASNGIINLRLPQTLSKRLFRQQV